MPMNLRESVMKITSWRNGSIDGRIWNLCKKTQRKISVNANEWWKVHILNRMEQENSQMDQILRTSTLNRERPDRGEEQGNLQPHFETHRGMMVTQGMISEPFQATLFLPSSRWIQCQTVRAERSIPYSTDIFRRDQRYKYIFGCNAGEKYRRLLERWWRSRIVWYVDRFRKTHRIHWRTGVWITLVPRETDKKKKTSRPDTLWPEICKDVSDALKCKEKQKWTIVKANFDNTRKLRGFSSLTQVMKNSRILRRMYVESKFQCPPQCLSRVDVRITRRLAALKGSARQNTLALLSPMNRWRSALKDLFTRITKIIL